MAKLVVKIMKQQHIKIHISNIMNNILKLGKEPNLKLKFLSPSHHSITT